MINLSFDKLRLITQNRNIRDYENKSKEDLIKALSETKPETPTPETPKPKPKPKLEIKVNKRKLKNSRHKFPKKEIDRYRKAFYVAKNKKYLSESKIKKTNRSFNIFKKSLRFKKFHGNIDSAELIMKTLIIMIIIMILLMMINIEKLGVLEHYFKN